MTDDFICLVILQGSLHKFYVQPQEQKKGIVLNKGNFSLMTLPGTCHDNEGLQMTARRVIGTSNMYVGPMPHLSPHGWKPQDSFITNE